ncbi:MAG: flippase [Dehalococcoidales bacterium]
MKNIPSFKVINKLLAIGLVRRVRASLFIQRVSLTLITRILILIIGFVLGVITARYLGPEGRGIYAVTASIVAMGTQFGNLGLHAANTYFIARDRNRLGTITGNTLWVSLIGGTIIALIATGILYFRPELASGVSIKYVIIGVVGIPFTLLVLLGQNILLGIQRIKVLNVFEFIQAIINVLVVVILLVLLKEGVLSLIAFTTIMTFLYGALVFWYLWRIEKNGLGFTPSLLKQMARYGFKAYLAALFSFLVIRLNMLMVNSMLGTEQAGIYSIATNAGDILLMIPASIGMILFPHVSAMSEGGWVHSKRVARATAIVMGAACIFVAIIARPFITFFYGQAFSRAADALLWLLPGVFFLSIETIIVMYLVATGLPKFVPLSWVIALIFNVTVNMFLIPRLGINGAAIVSSMTYTFVFILILVRFIKSAKNTREKARFW